MQHQGFFKKLKKTKEHGPKSVYRRVAVLEGLESTSFGARHSSRVSAWFWGVLEREMRRDKEGCSLKVKERKGYKSLLILCSSSDAQDQKQWAPTKAQKKPGSQADSPGSILTL